MDKLLKVLQQADKLAGLEIKGVSQTKLAAVVIAAEAIEGVRKGTKPAPEVAVQLAMAWGLWRARVATQRVEAKSE